MGTFNVTIEVDNIEDLRYETIDALVDTGASYLVIPRTILVSLGVQASERSPFTLADGRETQYAVWITSLRLDSPSFPVLTIFDDEGTSPPQGTVALEILGPAVDPVRRSLAPVTSLLMTQ